MYTKLELTCISLVDGDEGSVPWIVEVKAPCTRGMEQLKIIAHSQSHLL